MSQVCILTDSTAQFPVHLFPGSDLINVIPYHVQMDRLAENHDKDVKLIHLPASVYSNPGLQVQCPSVEEFGQMFINLGFRYREIVVILISAHLSPALENAQTAIEIAKCPAAIHLVDSQTTTVGLGLLVQAAASAAQQGLSGARISQLVRGLAPHVYTVFCLHNLSYLSRAGFIDPAQAVVGEMLDVVPFIILENGRLMPSQKVRGSRHLVDLLCEFVMEFNAVKHVALIQGMPPFDQEARLLRERLSGLYRTNSFSEHTLGVPLAALLGPRSLGLVVMENITDEW
jgi:DegV family protein with EDD domain